MTIVITNESVHQAISESLLERRGSHIIISFFHTKHIALTSTESIQQTQRAKMEQYIQMYTEYTYIIYIHIYMY